MSEAERVTWLQCAGAHLEAHARLHRANQTHDALRDPVPLRDRLGQLVLALSPVAGLDVIERDHWPPRIGHEFPGRCWRCARSTGSMYPRAGQSEVAITGDKHLAVRHDAPDVHRGSTGRRNHTLSVVGYVRRSPG